MTDAAEPAAVPTGDGTTDVEGPSSSVPGRGGLVATMLIAAVIVVVDQITKTWALRALDDRDIELVWTLQFNLAFNTGMAFSRGEGLGPVIGVVALVVVVVLLVRLGREGGRLAAVATGLVVGGAIGNICDRLFRNEGWLRGAVVDFIDLQWFPIFNVADMAITIGGALLIVTAFRGART